VAREGTAATVVAIAAMVQRAVAAADALSRKASRRGHRPAPFRRLTAIPLESVHKTGRLLIVDETPQMCGIGAEIAAQVTARGRRPGCAYTAAERWRSADAYTRRSKMPYFR
jgi:pyruvate/2-oxoglutarate/acetoin dehydrogenase E1 component